MAEGFHLLGGDCLRGICLRLNINISDAAVQPQLGFYKQNRFFIVPVLEQRQQILGQIGFSVGLVPLFAFTVTAAAGPDFAEQLGELVGHDRLEQIIHAVEPERLTGVFKVAVSAEDNKMSVRKALLLNCLQQFQAVHHGHLDVGNDQIHRVLFEKGQRLPAIGRSTLYSKTQRVPVHQHREALGDKWLVINQQRFQRRFVLRHPAAPPPEQW